MRSAPAEKMRFVVAVIAAGVVQLVPYLRADTPTALAIVYVTFAAFGAGFFASRRAWLAGALSVFLGAALYGVDSHLGYQSAGGTTIFDFFTAETSLLIGVAPYAFLGALAGLCGGWLRARALRAA